MNLRRLILIQIDEEEKTFDISYDSYNFHQLKDLFYFIFTDKFLVVAFYYNFLISMCFFWPKQLTYDAFLLH